MKLLMLLAGVMAVPTFAASGGDLDANDYVGVSFWLVTAALLAATAFFFVERDSVHCKMENIINNFWFSYRYCILALSLYERCLD